MELIFAYIFVVLFLTMFVDLLGDVLMEALGWLGRFLADCIETAIITIAKIAFKALAWSATHLWRGGVLACEFIIILADEIAHGGGEDAGDHDDDRHHDGEELAAETLYQQALGVIGLTTGFTQDDLRLRYRQLMKRAHPDAPGGSHKAAQEVNEAYEIVRRKHGWA